MLARGLDGLLYSEDNGNTWTDIMPNYPQELSGRVGGAMFLDKDRFVICDWSKPSIQLSDDNGQSFSEWLPTDIIDEMDAVFDSPSSIARAPSGRIYVFSRYKLYFTNDEGRSWSSMEHGLEDNVLNCFYIHDDEKFYVGSREGYFWTEDAGTTWDTLAIENIGNNKDVDDFLFISDDIGFALSSPKLFKTTDGGETWESTGPSYIYSLDYDGNTGALYGVKFALGNNGEVLKSNDLGESFNTIAYSCNAARGGGVTSNFDSYISLYNSGYIRKTDLEKIVSVDESSTILNQLDIYPNPVTNTLFIDRNKNYHGTISIYNLQGQRIQSLQLPQNSDHIRLDCSSLNPGIYFVRLDGNGEMGKFIKQ